jgi:hypothetical protein
LFDIPGKKPTVKTAENVQTFNERDGVDVHLLYIFDVTSCAHESLPRTN